MFRKFNAEKEIRELAKLCHNKDVKEAKDYIEQLRRDDVLETVKLELREKVEEKKNWEFFVPWIAIVVAMLVGIIPIFTEILNRIGDAQLILKSILYMGYIVAGFLVIMAIIILRVMYQSRYVVAWEFLKEYID